ncbi:unnamed protein product [Microthlaspi erraticum]|uniref:Uncharacterized protein n=1 Tax=Microthlaspi erraticum TaxID=1685480 RepID=A0A6D2L7K9_9BRAS|nr:unnamed protein product [Microthlaspi erraticum]
MAVALSPGFSSPLRNRSNHVIQLKPLPFTFQISSICSTRLLLLSSKRRLVLSCSTTDDNSITTTSVDSNKPGTESVEAGSNGSGKRAPLTARERLRAARVLSRYTEATPKPSKPKMGSQILEVLKESDKKSNRKPGLPQAPTNMLDDSKRGMPKNGLTFDLPGSADILIIAFSFVFISTVMFATTFLVWKLGAIHFNEN